MFDKIGKSVIADKEDLKCKTAIATFLTNLVYQLERWTHTNDSQLHSIEKMIEVMQDQIQAV